VVVKARRDEDAMALTRTRLRAPGERIGRNEAAYQEVVAFLEDEIALLDADDLVAWLALWAPDMQYRAPTRITRERNTGPEFADEMFHYDETFATLQLKVMRLTQTKSGWVENPASRTRRFIGGIRVFEGAAEGEYRVTSSILLLRSRFDESTPDLLSGSRDDVLRRKGASFEIARRTIYFDQVTLGLQNLAIYF
jgi:3-phenylpropionate/cinnamic acid dioxygenase small subunit